MRILTGAALVVVLSARAGAQQGGFVTQLGNDTIAIERFVRTNDVDPKGVLSFAWDTRVGRIAVTQMTQ